MAIKESGFWECHHCSKLTKWDLWTCNNCNNKRTGSYTMKEWLPPLHDNICIKLYKNYKNHKSTETHYKFIDHLVKKEYDPWVISCFLHVSLDENDSFECREHCNDHFYILLWIYRAHIEGLQDEESTIEVFKKMMNKGIGRYASLFYKKYSEAYLKNDSKNNKARAAIIIRKGLKYKSKPSKILKNKYFKLLLQECPRGSYNGKLSSDESEEIQETDNIILPDTEKSELKSKKNKLKSSLYIKSKKKVRFETKEISIKPYSIAIANKKTDENQKVNNQLTLKHDTDKYKIAQNDGIFLGPPIRIENIKSPMKKKNHNQDEKIESKKENLKNSTNKTNINVISNVNSKNRIFTKNIQKDEYKIKNKKEILKNRNELMINNTDKKIGIGNDLDYFMVNSNKYIIKKLIGTGGYSQVYKVIGNNSKKFALKHIRIRDASIIRNFEREIDILTKLKGENSVIKLIEYENDKMNSQIFLVFELGENDMATFLKIHAPLSAFSARYFWGQMVDAVRVLHKLRILHKDLKPQNFVLVDACVKLIDFGLANTVSEMTTHIYNEKTEGTPSYMAPESFNVSNGMVAVCRGTDIWSLGIILFEMVVGFTPFHKLKGIAKCYAIVSKYDKIPFDLIRDPTILDIVKKCLNRVPEKRPSAEEILDHKFLSICRNFSCESH